MLSVIRDAWGVCKYMGLKPMFGMQIPLVWTITMLSGVYFHNVRRTEINPAFNKLQGSAAADEAGH